MPGFSVLAPLLGSVIKSGSDNTNRRNQFEQGNLRNAFSIFTGGPRANLSPLLANNSVNTLLQGAAGAANSQTALNNQDIQKQLVNALNARRNGGGADQKVTLDAALLQAVPEILSNSPANRTTDKNFTIFSPGAAFA